MNSGKIRFLIQVGKDKHEEENGVCTLRITEDYIDVILEVEYDWERNYKVRCEKQTKGFYGDDKQGVQASINFINPKTLMGYWREDGLLMPIIITLD
jgi:hypothetical protein